MIKLRNANYLQFLSETEDKRIICFGAGGTLSDFFLCNQGKIELLERVDFILDNNPAKKGEIIYFNLKKIPVISLSDLIKSDTLLIKYVIILTLANEHIPDVVSQLDNLSMLDDMHCYIGMTAMQWGKEIYPPQQAAILTPSIKYTIPKNIHYCWFGNSPMGDMELECIDSWKKYCSDYEITRWDESNYDITNKPHYVRQAYDAGKYAFVSDYARLDIICNYGGIYLDTDVELLKNLKNLLHYKAFFGFESLNLVNTGLGFGSIPGNLVLKNLMGLYRKIAFRFNDGALNITSCPEYHTEYFRKQGLFITNRMQLFDDMIFLPSDYFCPFNQRSTLYEFTYNTTSNHRFNISWVDDEIRENRYNEIKQNEDINVRLQADW